MYKIFHSKTFDNKISKLSKEFSEWLDKIENQLVENPYVGDPIRVKWLREKKRDKFRVYYLIYEESKSVYMVAISEKKDQQKVINGIFLLLDQFKDEIEGMLKNAKEPT